MKMRLFFLCTAAALTACAAAPTPTSPTAAGASQEIYEVDSKHTFANFEISHLGFSTHRGRFNKTTGSITLDRAAHTGALTIMIDANSVDTGDKRLEQRLREPDWLDTEAYPTIEFKSSHLRFDGDTLVGVDGELTLHGVTKPVSLTVTSFHCGNRKLIPLLTQYECGADAHTQIKRSDFGLTSTLSMVGDDVKLLIQIEALKH